MTNLTLNYLNLHTYKMGALELPATENEINEFWENLNPNGSHDCELQWVEADFSTDLDKLSFAELVELSEMDEDDAETLVNIYEAVGYFDEAKTIFENGEYTLFTDCDDMSDVAYSWIHDHIGSIEDAVSNPEFYFDLDSFKRDLEIDGYFSEIEEEQGEELDEETKEYMAEELADCCDKSNYFDYEAFGRDMEIEGNFTYLGNGNYIQIWA
jgi:antirestriction protein